MVESFESRLARAIRTSKCTRGGLAMGAGILPSVLASYIKGQAQPSYDELQRIADLLGTTTAWLLTGKHPL